MSVVRSTLLPLLLGLASCGAAPAGGSPIAVPVADIVPWDRVEFVVREGTPHTWTLPVHNPSDRIVELPAPTVEGCGACLAASWGNALGEAGRLRLGPRARGVLRVTYGGARLVGGRYVLSFGDGTGVPVQTRVYLRRAQRPLSLEQVGPTAVAGRRDAVRFSVRGEVPPGPVRISVASGAATRAVLSRPRREGGRSLVRVLPARSWDASLATVVTLASRDGAVRIDVPVRVTARDPFRVRRARDGDRNRVVVTANVPCSIRVDRTGTSESDFRLAARERLLIPEPGDLPIRVRDIHGEFEIVLRGES